MEPSNKNNSISESSKIDSTHRNKFEELFNIIEKSKTNISYSSVASITNSSNWTSAENKINLQRLKIYGETFEKDFIQYINEYGIDTQVDKFIRNRLDRNSAITKSSTIDSTHRNKFEEFFNIIEKSKTNISYSSFASITDSSNCTSVENKLNQQRLKTFREKFEKEFIQYIKEETFEYGIDTQVDKFLRNCLDLNSAITKEWINLIFINNYMNDEIIAGILRVISHFDYNTFAPQGITMALAALSHKNSEIKECGIRALENWGTMECLKTLISAELNESWLIEYAQEVVSDLSSELEG